MLMQILRLNKCFRKEIKKEEDKISMCVVDEMKTEAQRKQATFRPIRSGPAQANPVLIGRLEELRGSLGEEPRTEEGGGRRRQSRAAQWRFSSLAPALVSLL